MSQSATAMAGDPPPFGIGPWLPYAYNSTPWYPQHWDAPSKPKVMEVALIGHEEYHVIGVFVFRWDARTAAARALLAYRRYWRTPAFDDYPHRPRGTDLKARITTRVIDQYATPWDAK